MKLTVSFRSEWEEVACTCFERTLEPFLKLYAPQISATLGLVHYHFRDDAMLRDVRSWGSDALGCGLITSFSVTVE